MKKPPGANRGVNQLATKKKAGIMDQRLQCNLDAPNAQALDALLDHHFADCLDFQAFGDHGQSFSGRFMVDAGYKKRVPLSELLPVNLERYRFDLHLRSVVRPLAKTLKTRHRTSALGRQGTPSSYPLTSACSWPRCSNPAFGVP